MTVESVVCLRGVGKRFAGGPWVLDGVDLDLTPGSVTAVLGGNGSGKSTLLRIVAGLSLPSTGTVRRGVRRVGYVPERFTVADRMSAVGYLTHLGRIAGLSTVDSAARAGELCERLALHPGPRTPMRRLSKGNAQKVALAAAVLAQPALLVLDEPWSGLDTATHPVLADLIGETAAGGGHVMVSGHDGALAKQIADTVYHVGAGRLHAEPSDAVLMRLHLHPGAPLDWSAAPGVLERDQAGAPVLVTAEHCDTVLAIALRNGWSVREVRADGAAE